MKKRLTNFFVAFTLCILSIVTIAGLNQTALENELTGNPGKVFDIEEQEGGVKVTFFDSNWVADRTMVEQLKKMAQGLGKSAWIMRSPGLEGLRCLTALGLQYLPEEVLNFKQVEEQNEEDPAESKGSGMMPGPVE